MLKIHFEDQGQDLLWLVVDTDTEQVVEAGPFHNDIYEGKYIFCPSFIAVGDEVHYSDTQITRLHQPLITFRYLVDSIDENYEPTCKPSTLK